MFGLLHPGHFGLKYLLLSGHTECCSVRLFMYQLLSPSITIDDSNSNEKQKVATNMYMSASKVPVIFPSNWQNLNFLNRI
jgi:hypothetical protein